MMPKFYANLSIKKTPITGVSKMYIYYTGKSLFCQIDLKIRSKIEKSLNLLALQYIRLLFIRKSYLISYKLLIYVLKEH